ncbi:hypothetical protein Mycch_1436 [Mycolicibacterium chubuense NBB4]|uniref:Secreted protein n=1 Tax=Mycolicibacterium chubuense (strain NBB4) TaxID=710421 RepID=I4BG30_MYCCN|nr:hypothetical protein [Mycolicibacterium chubuense]AFM16237.1 hypothetical protein Mycch_1436 [Mycolicibacterium chubuense NBB4]
MNIGQFALAAAVLLFVSSASAAAEPPELKGSLNGTFRAQSNGDFAKSNEMFYDEQTVIATWTITSTCSNPTDCTGTVTSDQGWSAPIYKMSGLWNIKHPVPRWEPCPDGSAADGLQHYRFYAVDAHTGQADNSQSDLFAGLDETLGPSGACGVSKPLLISLPFKLTRIS